MTTATDRTKRRPDASPDAANGFSADSRAYLRVEADRWRVETPTAVYFVDTSRQPWTCSCTGFRYRRQCRHVDAVKRHAAGGQALGAVPTKEGNP
jgi:hypothetical protein